MPELPEVETIARSLRQGENGTPPLAGARILRAEVNWERHIATPSPTQFQRAIRGRRIENVERRGKYLVFPLDRGTMLIHLKMTGDLSLQPAEAPRGPYDHTVLHLDNDLELRFSDARKFGKVFLVDDPMTMFSRLGPEPLSEEFTPSALAARLEGRSRGLKGLLLDQTFVAGVGNIYADEALYRARLHPLHSAAELDRDQIEGLWHGIRASLQAGLAANGASIDWVYRRGSYQNHFLVYGREGENCPNCGTPIEKITVAQRGTHFCPQCQPGGSG
jgi:formamidopyrimidine-DNA glycosylase